MTHFKQESIIMKKVYLLIRTRRDHENVFLLTGIPYKKYNKLVPW